MPETTVSTNFYFNPKVDVVVVPYPSFNRDFTSSSPPTPPQPDVSAAVKHVLLLYNIIKRHHPDGWSVQGQFPNVKTVTVLLDSNISTRKDTGGRPKYDNIWGINGKDVDLRTLNLDVAYVDELQLVYDLTTDHDVKRLYRHSQVNGDARWLKESCQDFGGPKGGGWRQSVQTKIMKLLKANSLDKSENKPRPPTGFIDLPFELREMIWNYALQQEPARVINLRPTSKFFNESGSDLERRLLPNGAHGPALLHACYESRAVALQKYTLQKMHFSWSAPFYFDSSKDIVALVFTDAAAVEKRKDMADLPPPVRDIDEASPRTLLLPFSTLQKIPMPNADARDSLIQWFAHYPNVHTYIILLDADVYNAGAEAYGGLPEEHYDPAEVVDAFEVAGPNSHRWQAYAETLRRGWVVVYLMRNMSRLFKIYGLRFEVRIVKIKERQGPSAMYMSRAGD